MIEFTGHVRRFRLNVTLLLTVPALAISALFQGVRLSKKIDGNKLKKGFGWFVLIMGLYILAQQLFFQTGGTH